MNQCELDAEIAALTGESLREIRRRGFSIIGPPSDDELDDLTGPQIVDWDLVDRQRTRAA